MINNPKLINKIISQIKSLTSEEIAIERLSRLMQRRKI